MALVDYDTNPFRFIWNVLDIFPPFREAEATFLHDRPLPLQWTAKLRPTHRSRTEWGFVFSLRCSGEGEGDFAVVAERIEVEIYTFGRARDITFDEGTESGHVFCEANDHTFETREVFFPVNLAATCGSFEVTVAVHFEEREWREVNRLSTDLEKILFKVYYSDLMLWSTAEVYHVHSCIMRARWPSLFKEHPREAVVFESIRTDFPDHVLEDIITYMYTGRGQLLDRVSRSREYETELRRAIEKYALRRIRRISFDYQPAYEMLLTGSNVLSISYTFKFNDPLDGRRRELRQHFQNTIDVACGLEFSLNQQNPSFTYDLKLECASPLHVQVVCAYQEGGVAKEIVHERDYFVNSDRPLLPGEILFEGDSPEMGVFLDKCRRGQSLEDVERTLLLLLQVSNGSRLSQVFLLNEAPVKDDRELEVLSEELLRLLHTRTQTDLELHCGDEIYRLHRAIIAARVPNWKEVLTPFEGDEVPELEEGLVPRRVRCSLSKEALLHILDYIYSGQVFPCDRMHYEEIRDFALNAHIFFLGGFYLWMLKRRDD